MGGLAHARTTSVACDYIMSFDRGKDGSDMDSNGLDGYGEAKGAPRPDGEANTQGIVVLRRPEV
jgi:hypothetical protein